MKLYIVWNKDDVYGVYESEQVAYFKAVELTQEALKNGKKVKFAIKPMELSKGELEVKLPENAHYTHNSK